MYKLTRPDGFDFYTGTINYRDAIGTTVRVSDYDPPEKGPCGRGLHASRNPNDCFIGAYIPCAAFKVKGIQPIARDSYKTRYRALKVIEEIHDLDTLFGWKYSEAIDPINPFKITPPKITSKQIQLLTDWASVWNYEQDSTWNSVWESVRDSVRVFVWNDVLDAVRDFVWAYMYDFVWNYAPDSILQAYVGNSVRTYVYNSVRNYIWAYISSFFPRIKRWKYIDHKKGVNPFQPGIDLWRMGLVPSFDGETWRLHGYENRRVLWSGKI